MEYIEHDTRYDHNPSTYSVCGVERGADGRVHGYIRVYKRVGLIEPVVRLAEFEVMLPPDVTMESGLKTVKNVFEQGSN